MINRNLQGIVAKHWVDGNFFTNSQLLNLLQNNLLSFRHEGWLSHSHVHQCSVLQNRWRTCHDETNNDDCIIMTKYQAGIISLLPSTICKLLNVVHEQRCFDGKACDVFHLDCCSCIQSITARVLGGSANIFVSEPDDDKIIGWFLIHCVLSSRILYGGSLHLSLEHSSFSTKIFHKIV